MSLSHLSTPWCLLWLPCVLTSHCSQQSFLQQLFNEPQVLWLNKEEPWKSTDQSRMGQTDRLQSGSKVTLRFLKTVKKGPCKSKGNRETRGHHLHTRKADQQEELHVTTQQTSGLADQDSVTRMPAHAWS